MKFGGAALGDRDSIARSAAVVAQALPRTPMVVVSAHAGVTDQLLALAQPDAQDREGTAVMALHRRLLAELELPADLLDPLLAELGDLLRGLRLVGAVTPRARDHLASFGERLCARTFAAVLTAQGVPAVACDAWDLGLRTDSAFGRARPLPDDGRIPAALAKVAGVPVVTGFIAKDERGNVTTLGRNGSDYSAALLGAAAGAAEIQVWKDVAGVHTADPKLVPAATPIRSLGFDEACELSWFGSKVLHPATMLPALQKGIPLSVRSLRDPDAPGTSITGLGVEAGSGPAPRAVAHRRSVALVTASPRPGGGGDFQQALLAVCQRHGEDVAILALGEHGATLLTGGEPQLHAELQAVGSCQVRTGLGLLGVIGCGLGRSTPVASAMLAELAGRGIPVEHFALGARLDSLPAIVAGERLAEAVTALHERFFGG